MNAPSLERLLQMLSGAGRPEPERVAPVMTPSLRANLKALYMVNYASLRGSLLRALVHEQLNAERLFDEVPDGTTLTDAHFPSNIAFCSGAKNGACAMIFTDPHAYYRGVSLFRAASALLGHGKPPTEQPEPMQDLRTGDEATAMSPAQVLDRVAEWDASEGQAPSAEDLNEVRSSLVALTADLDERRAEVSKRKADLGVDAGADDEGDNA